MTGWAPTRYLAAAGLPHLALAALTAAYLNEQGARLTAQDATGAVAGHVALSASCLAAALLSSIESRRAISRNGTGVPRFNSLSIGTNWTLALASAFLLLFGEREAPVVTAPAGRLLATLGATALSLLNLAALRNPSGGIARWMEKRGDAYGSACANALLASSAVLFCAVAPEAAFRLLFPSERSEPAGYGSRYDFVLSPYVMFAEPDVRHGGTLNRQGFQGLEFPATRGDGEVRIALIGGSAAHSGGANHSIAANIERILRDRYPGRPVRVANFGRQSYLSAQELILLQRSVLRLSPDIVIVYDGFNDLWVPYSGMEPMGVGYPFLYTNLSERIEGEGIVNIGNLSRFLSSRSALSHRILSRRKESGPARAAFDIAACSAEYETSLYQMAVLAKAYGSKTILATQPFIGSKNIRTPRENVVAGRRDVAGLGELYEGIRKAGRSAAERSGALYVDTLDVFRDDPREIYYDPVHVIPQLGNPVVGARLADAIIRRGLLDPP